MPGIRATRRVAAGDSACKGRISASRPRHSRSRPGLWADVRGCSRLIAASWSDAGDRRGAVVDFEFMVRQWVLRRGRRRP